MIATILLPALVALIGALVYGLSGNPKAIELARAAWAVGLGVTLLVVGQAPLVALVVTVVAALVYALTSGKVVELGRLAFWVGLGVLVYQLGQHPIHIST
jgi:hypothetical protein